MPKLTDTDLVILSAAARRGDGEALPLPKALGIKGEAATRMLDGLRKKGLLEEKPTARKAGAWRESKGGQRMMLVITGFRAEGDRRRVCSTAAEAVRPGQIAAEAASPGAENGRLQAKGSSGGAGRPAGHKAGPAGRSPEEQERRHHRRGRRGDRLAGALGARHDQRHAEEETRPRGDLRANREARACLSYRRARLIQRVERKAEAMCTYDGYVSPYLLRPPRSCDQVMGTNRVQPSGESGRHPWQGRDPGAGSK